MLIDINLKIQVIVRCASAQLTPGAWYTDVLAVNGNSFLTAHLRSQRACGLNVLEA